MKKFIIVIISVVFIFNLAACSSNDLSILERRLVELEMDLEVLETQIENSEMQIEAYQNRIAILEDQRLSTRNKISELETQVADLEKFQNEVKLFLAKEYYLVPGDTFQLFYRSIIQAVDPYHYHIKLVTTVGKAYNRYFEWTPKETDVNNTYQLKIEVRNDLGNILAKATTNLIVKTISPNATSRRILCIGDSLTANGYWLSHAYKQYLDAGGIAHTLLGTIEGSYNLRVNYEGRGGWQWSSYVNGYDEDIKSPFQASKGSEISFIDYCSRNGYSGIDDLYILMTWNGIGGSYREFSLNSEPFASAKKLIDKFHEEYPAGRVTLLGIPQPSVNSGLGAHYTLNYSYSDNYGQFVSALNYNKQLEDFANMTSYKSFMRYIDVKAQFDCEYNMPYEGKPVNKYSNVMESVGTGMGMHPNTAGYLQIGDVFYRVLSHDSYLK